MTIRGNGLIEGNGFIWWWAVIITGVDSRPNLLDILTSKNTHINGLVFQNAAQYHLNLENALDMRVENLLIRVNVTPEQFPGAIPTFPLNTDGIDISGRNIYFRNLTIENYDDAVAVKPTHMHQSPYSNCTENILVEDCLVKLGVGMSIGSVPPNTDVACIRNVTFRNVRFEAPLKVQKLVIYGGNYLHTVNLRRQGLEFKV